MNDVELIKKDLEGNEGYPCKKGKSYGTLYNEWYDSKYQSTHDFLEWVCGLKILKLQKHSSTAIAAMLELIEKLETKLAWHEVDANTQIRKMKTLKEEVKELKDKLNSKVKQIAAINSYDRINKKDKK